LVQDDAHSVKVLPVTDEGRHGCWTWSKGKIADSPDLIVSKQVRGGKHRIYRKDYLRGDKYSTLPKSLLMSKLFNHEVGKESLRDILPEKVAEFPHPKSPELVKELIRLSPKTGIVLDSFAGSGTTAQAVLELNQEEQARRNFILVEMENYADHTTAERVRRVIRGYNYIGTQKTELLRKKITWTKIQSSRNLISQVETIESEHSCKYDRIIKKVDAGELVVTGELKIKSQSEGLGGGFTYCTLEKEVDIDKMLTGKNLPSYEEIGAILFHMATNQILETDEVRENDFYLGSTGDCHVWLMYKPCLDWLKSPESALTLTRARKFASYDQNKHHIVFAPAQFVSRKTLSEQKIKVEYAQLPLSLYRITQS